MTMKTWSEGGNKMNNHMNAIVDAFVANLQNFMNKGIITVSDLRVHRQSNIHSWLQYIMITAGEHKGLLTIPEVKLRFTTPIYPERDFGLIGMTRARHFSRVDLAFYDYEKNCLGVSEIFTMDESHGALPSIKLAEPLMKLGKLEKYWVTPRDSILHMTQYASSRPNFIILVTILCKRASSISWKMGIEEIDTELGKEKNYYRVFKPYWIELSKALRINNSLLVISEDGIERVE